MLNPHGHWQQGAIDPVVQARCAAFAQFGWTALAVDSVHVEHIASGVNSIGAMTWHNQRALDLLQTLDVVDPARIGVTGASGGGQQTYHLMALEDRLAAAAPMVMACYFHEIISDRGGEAGVVGLLAAHLCSRIARVATHQLGANYAENGNRLPLCPELLRFADRPNLIETLPRGCDHITLP